MAVNKWNLLSAEDRRTWIEKADGLNDHDVSELTGKQKKQQIKKLKSNLLHRYYTSITIYQLYTKYINYDFVAFHFT